MPTAPAATKTKPSGPPSAESGAARFTVAAGIQARAERVVIYGEGGIGKSSLAALAPKPIFLDCELGTSKLDVPRVGGVSSWQDMRDALHEPSIWRDCRTVVLDSGTASQEWATEHTIRTVKHDKGKPVTSIEDYGWGKGYVHVYETFLALLGDLDAHVRAGRNVVVICHQTVERAPNPDGEDFLRYEPALQQPPKAGRIRDRVQQWTDHLLFIQYDKKVKDGKAEGKGTRTIWPQALPTYWAKSRSLRDPIVFEDPAVDPERAAEVWKLLGLK